MSGPSTTDGSEKNPIMTALIHELDLYFSGASKSFSVPLDPAAGTPFQRRVWSELTRIPYGETRSYGEIAAAVGNPQGCAGSGARQ